MKLVDTCVWVELFADTPTGRRYRSLFEAPAQVLVPTLVLFELRRWALRELGDAEADRVIGHDGTELHSNFVHFDRRRALRQQTLTHRLRVIQRQSCRAAPQKSPP